ncbi:MAG TPA: biotin carboxylase N-terminal domain-containing protein, partial [Acidimicrobiales bacterium]|nr:biotin carboxylase N-terminal domain-containing protein [Acidimicrobiales bacterium]
MFERVLVANRGEIAVRITRTLRKMGITSIAVFSEADNGLPHVAMADVAVPIGEPQAYLNPELLISVGKRHAVTAVHPGYGFLSENAEFARACASAGITFIGPPPEAISVMGDKINAKRTVAAYGVPVVPGRVEPGLDDNQLAEAAREVGFPVLLKPSAGGGGKGMRLVEFEEDLATAIESARREASHSFGDSTLLVERFLSHPRHIEMQVFADTHGTCVALGDRECSLQRRHQKVIEEAPSPLLLHGVRPAMAESAIAAARACGYVGAGTVEFIVSADRPNEYFFMEMNTRLQVEHPVTEAVTGLDLVEWQVRVASGEALPWKSQQDVPAPNGHAIEARIYAEDPSRGFLPSAGPILLLREPRETEHIRVDSGISPGVEVGTLYDPMLSKVIAWGRDRGSALRHLDQALASTTVLGLSTKLGFLRRLLADQDVIDGHIHTGLVEERLPQLAPKGTPDRVLVAVALLSTLDLRPKCAAPNAGPWALRDGWRVGDRAPLKSQWSTEGDRIEIEVLGPTVTVNGRSYSRCRAGHTGDGSIAVEIDGDRHVYQWVRRGPEVWMGEAGDAWRMIQETRSLIRASSAGP